MLGRKSAVMFYRSSAVEYLLGSRTVSYNPPRHSGVGFRRDF
jgi:hypothetical protein